MAFSLALITGATSGIGEALAKLLAKNKINLILTGRQLDKLIKLQKDLSAFVSVEILSLDLSKERKSLISLIKTLQPDLIINNAGFGIYGSVKDYSIESILNMLEVNNKALVEITLEGAKNLLANQKKGIIINVSSAAGFITYPYLAAYAASKSFVNAFSKASDIELKPKGIRVLAACPGQVATEFSVKASGANHYKQNVSYLVMSQEFAAQAIWKQIQTGKRIHIFDWKYQLAIFLSKLIPEKFLSKILISTIKKRLK